MSKISISKKTAWSLILKINSKFSYKNNLVNINERMFEITYSSLDLEFQAIYNLKMPGIHFDNLHNNSKVLKFCRSS